MPKVDPDKIDPMQAYLMDEEKAYQKRGLDHMAIDEVEPPKLPTHKHSTTLHRGKTKKTTRYEQGGIVVSDSDWRRNKAREINEGDAGASKRMLGGMNDRTKYAKK